MLKKGFFLFAFLCMSLTNAQQAVLKGQIFDTQQKPIKGVTIQYLNLGTSSDEQGNYELLLPSNDSIQVVFKHLSYSTHRLVLYLQNDETRSYSPTLVFNVQAIPEVKIDDANKESQGIISIDPEKINTIPGANQGVENVLMSLPGVNNNNELSTQYNVRGGNFDENLVYVNGIEVYRPFLVRSGQQEGLSFVNSSMVNNIKFSSGGFQAKYGDKLSSVLDITYRRPHRFKSQLELSLLGGGLTIEDVFLKNKLRMLIGLRYRDNNLFIKSKDIKTSARPSFVDGQVFLTYDVHPKLRLEFLSTWSENSYDYKPIKRRTKFGSLANPLELVVDYEGNESDKFRTTLGAIKAAYSLNEQLDLSVTSSVYHALEEEYYDIHASYHLAEINSDFGSDEFGSTVFSEGIGSQLNHARNDLDALIGNTGVKATYKKDDILIQAGVKFQFENIKDRINEWEVIDSLGFHVRPQYHQPNEQPYEPFTGAIKPFHQIRSKNEVTIDRLIWFAQYSKKDQWKEHDIWYNIGLRAHNWNVSANEQDPSNQIIYSLRGQFAIKPDWERDMLFRVSGGMYNQAPFYKELRNASGVVMPWVDSQESIHFVLGNHYSFKLWNRPFKLVSEIYYKNLSKLNLYSVDNVRIRYRADNQGKGYAFGLDVRLNGEFVPGTDSWVSFGILKTEENYQNLGYLARPTDQRIKFGMLFQDYVPNIPNIKMYLNLVYNTGLPGGAPLVENPYDYQFRLNDYKRADIGVSYVFTDANNSGRQNWLKKFEELSVGIEIFNFFDINNSITTTWVRDAYSKQFYGIPNGMTGRVLNFKLHMNF